LIAIRSKAEIKCAEFKISLSTKCKNEKIWDSHLSYAMGEPSKCDKNFPQRTWSNIKNDIRIAIK